MDDFSRLGVTEILTDNSILISSSKYLNHPGLREAMATALLRRNGRERRVGWDSTPIVRAYREIRDVAHINGLLAAERKKNPALDAWFAERFVSTYSRQDLARCPPGSLGQAFHAYLVKQDLDIALDPKLRQNPDWRPETDLDYFDLRAAQTHDFDHILGGVAFDALSETLPFFLRIENCFRHLSPELAGELCAVHLLLVLPMLTRTMLHYPRAWDVTMSYVRRGAELGRGAQPLFMTRYEPYFDLPIPEVRKRLGIPAVEQVDSTELSSYWAEGPR